jgi:hypothetical protein
MVTALPAEAERGSAQARGARTVNSSSWVNTSPGRILEEKGIFAVRLRLEAQARWKSYAAMRGEDKYGLKAESGKRLWWARPRSLLEGVSAGGCKMWWHGPIDEYS